MNFRHFDTVLAICPCNQSNQELIFPINVPFPAQLSPPANSVNNMISQTSHTERDHCEPRTHLFRRRARCEWRAPVGGAGLPSEGSRLCDPCSQTAAPAVQIRDGKGSFASARPWLQQTVIWLEEGEADRGEPDVTQTRERYLFVAAVASLARKWWGGTGRLWTAWAPRVFPPRSHCKTCKQALG